MPMAGHESHMTALLQSMKIRYMYLNNGPVRARGKVGSGHAENTFAYRLQGVRLCRCVRCRHMFKDA